MASAGLWLSHQAAVKPSVSVKYLPCCLARGCDTLAAFVSKLAVRAIMWLTNSGTHILVYLPVTYVPGGITSKEKTLGFTSVYAQ